MQRYAEIVVGENKQVFEENQRLSKMVASQSEAQKEIEYLTEEVDQLKILVESHEAADKCNQSAFKRVEEQQVEIDQLKSWIRNSEHHHKEAIEQLSMRA